MRACHKQAATYKRLNPYHNIGLLFRRIELVIGEDNHFNICGPCNEQVK